MATTLVNAQRADVVVLAGLAAALVDLTKVTTSEPARRDVLATINSIAKRVKERENQRG